MRLFTMTIVALLSSTAAAAESVEFSVGGTMLSVPVPAGYCLPKGRDKETADILASGDKDNATLTTLIRCDQAESEKGVGNDYILIKSPRLVLGQTISRPDLLASLEAEFGKAGWQDGTIGSKATRDASNGLSEAFQTQVNIEGDIGVRGSDGDCAYVGGTLQFSGGGISYPIILGGCITSSGGKVVMVYSYDDPGKGGGVIGKMRTARNVAMSITPTP